MLGRTGCLRGRAVRLDGRPEGPYSLPPCRSIQLCPVNRWLSSSSTPSVAFVDADLVTVPRSERRLAHVTVAREMGARYPPCLPVYELLSARNQSGLLMAPPSNVDRLIVHQFDAARPAPGGIDTCIRGLLRYRPRDVELAVVGVDALGGGRSKKRAGTWERHLIGDRSFWFLPVATLDPADQARRVPHSIRLAAGLSRYWSKLPHASTIQAHRADIGAMLLTLTHRPLHYFVHTQAAGITSKSSDSLWKRLPGVHKAMEKRALDAAISINVFNPAYADELRMAGYSARSFPTWWDPALLKESPHRDRHAIAWVGRLEEPKDPALAVESFQRLVQRFPGKPWRLTIAGVGTHFARLEEMVARLPAGVADRVVLPGRLSPEAVADLLSQAGLFLMTSYPGYEGFPRVLVEAMACGLPAVVTEGSDTGRLIRPETNGYVTSRNPDDVADALFRATALSGDRAREAVSAFSAPSVVEAIFRA